jgi:hypothetical protein
VAKEAEPLDDYVYKYNQSTSMEALEGKSIDYENIQEIEKSKGGLVEKSIDYHYKSYPSMNRETLEVRSIYWNDTSILLMTVEEKGAMLFHYHRI